MDSSLGRDTPAPDSLGPPASTSKPTSRSTTPNPRTSIKWKGKNVIICIPTDTREVYGEGEYATRQPLTKEEVVARLKKWEEEGYTVWSAQGTEQVKEIFPDDAMRGEIKKGDIIVSIPDKRDWEAYVDALREERLRMLGVALDDEPVVSSPSLGQGQTPMSSLAYPSNPFSPPIPTNSALSNPRHINGFSPAGTPSPGFLARNQSISLGPGQGFPGTSAPWEAAGGYPLYGSPGIPDHGFGQFGNPMPGVWTPAAISTRGASPATGYQFQGLYPEEPSFAVQQSQEYHQSGEPHVPMLGGYPERFHQAHNVRQPSPLAFVSDETEAPIMSTPQNDGAPGLTIVEPKPTHTRNRLSVSLRKDIEGTGPNTQGPEDEGIQTNPVSPAVEYPEQPAMPDIENDVHIGPELAENPEDDAELEKDAEERQREANKAKVNEFVPQKQQEYLSPRSFDEQDPAQNSAMAMLLAGDGLAGAGRLGHNIRDDVSDAHTNISEIDTNPSVPGSPRQHRPTGSWDNAAFGSEQQFQYDPSAVYNFGQEHFGQHKPQGYAPQTSNFGFSESSFNVSAPAFRPSLFDEASGPSAQKFNVTAPTFTPSSFAKFEQGMPDIVKPPPVKKVIPIVRPPSQDKETAERERAVDDSSRAQRGRRIRSGFRGSSFDGDEIPRFAAPGENDATEMRESSAEAEKVANEFGFNEGKTREDDLSTVHSGPPSPMPPVEEKPKFNPAAKEFSFKPNPLAQEFKFEFSAPSTAPSFSQPMPQITYTPVAKDFNLGESASGTEEASSPDKHPMPTQSDLDEVMDAINAEADLPSYNFPEQDGEENESEVPTEPADDLPSWKPSGPKRPAIPTFAEPETPGPNYRAATRSAAPSPTPGRIESYKFVHENFHSRTTSPNQLPAHLRQKSTAIGYADDVDSDWNDMEIPEDFSKKLRAQAQTRLMLDSNVEEFIGSVLKSYLEPVERNLNNLTELVRAVNLPPAIPRGDREDSDADDEDDEEPAATRPSTSNREKSRERKREMLKIAVTEAVARELGVLPSKIDEIRSVVTEAAKAVEEKVSSRLDERDMELVEEVLKEIKALLQERVEEQLTGAVEGNWKSLLDAAFAQQGTVLKDESTSVLDSVRKTENNIIDIVSNLVADVRVQGGQSQRSGRQILEALDDVKQLVKDQEHLGPEDLSALSEKLQGAITAIDEKLSATSEVSRADAQKLSSALETLSKAKSSGAGATPEQVDKIVNSALSTLTSHIRDELSGVTERILFIEETNTNIFSDKVRKVSEIVQQATSYALNKDEVEGLIREYLTPVMQRLEGGVTKEDISHVLASVMEELEKISDMKTEIVRSVRETQGGGERSPSLPMPRSEEVIAKMEQMRLILLGLPRNDEVGRMVERVISAKLEDLKSVIAQNKVDPDEETLQDVLNAVNGARQEILAGVYLPKDDRVLTAIETVRAQLPNNESLVQYLEAIKQELVDGKPQRDLIMQNLRDGLLAIQQQIEEKPTVDKDQVAYAVVAAVEGIREELEALGKKVEDGKGLREENLRAVMEEHTRDAAGTLETVVEQTLRQRDDSTVKELARISSGIETLRTLPAVVEQTLRQRDDGTVKELTRIGGGIEALRTLPTIVEQTLRQRDDGTVKELGRIGGAIEGLRTLPAVVESVKDAQGHALANVHAGIREILENQRSIASGAMREPTNVEELKLRVTALENMLSEANARVDREAKDRHVLQEKTIALERHLQLAEEERKRFKSMADDNEKRLRDISVKRNEALVAAQMRCGLLEGVHSRLTQSVSDLGARNVVLEAQVKELQSRENGRKADLDATLEENNQLRKAVAGLRAEMEESMRVREGFRRKFDRLQEDMRQAASEIAHEQGMMRRMDQEQKARIEVLEAKLEHERKSREPLEREIERFREMHEEDLRVRATLEQVRKVNARNEETIKNLQAQLVEQEQREARLLGEIEGNKAATSDAVEQVQKQLEKTTEELELLQAQYRTQKENLKAMLEEAASDKRAALAELRQEKAEVIAELKESRITAMREAAEAKQAAINEVHAKYEAQIEELRSIHERALKNTRQDGERGQHVLRERLRIAHSQIETAREKIALLEEKLQVATSAAQAAAQAAKQAKSQTRRASVAQSVSAGSNEKFDAQALRQSIAALQDQVISKDEQVEELTSKLKALEKESKQKLQQRESEVSWLKELWAVRVGELEEILRALEKPDLDRASLQDAVTRLKANLEMELQERERQGTNGVGAPGFASPLANLTTKLPLAAAWGNWRKTAGTASPAPNSNTLAPPTSGTPKPTKSTSGLFASVRGISPSPAGSEISRPGSAQSFLTGLLTPPTGAQKAPGTPTPNGATNPTSTSNSAMANLGFGRIAGLTRGNSSQKVGRVGVGVGSDDSLSFEGDADARGVEIGMGLGLGLEEDEDMGDDGFGEVAGDGDNWGTI